MIDNTEVMEQTIPDTEVTETDSELDWETEEVAEETTESNEEETETEEAAEETSQQEEMFPEDLVVYGETKQVTMAEAKNLIQKGLAFDRAKEGWEKKLGTAKADPRLAFVDELAKEAGKTTAEYMSEVQMRRQYGALLEQYGDLSDVPDNVMQMFTENTAAQKEKAEKAFAQQKAQQREEELIAELEAFRENHPDVGDIPQEVIELKSQGESLEGAFAIIQYKQLKADKERLEKELSIAKQNNKNRQAAMPSASSKAQKETGLVWEW